MYYDPEFIKLRLTDLVSHTDMDKRYSQVHFVSLDMKGCIDLPLCDVADTPFHIQGDDLYTLYSQYMYTKSSHTYFQYATFTYTICKNQNAVSAYL